MTPEEYEAHAIGTWTFDRPKATVVHWNDRPKAYFYIGRPSFLGNPFTARDYGRTEAIRLFREHFELLIKTNPGFKANVDGLRGMVLVCHCKPLACHGDVIAEYLNALP